MLRLEHVFKRLGDFQLKDINMEMVEGEYFLILGPTGAGKTAVLETIAGMYWPDQGEIWFGSKNLSKLHPEQREIGFVYQDYALFPHLTVAENIIFGLKMRKTSKREVRDKLGDIAAMLGIEHLYERHPFALSGGEQQRVALARALVISPKILLLDEPLSALDPCTKEMMQDELKKIHSTFKTTVLHITHDFSEAFSLADRVAVMKNGEIVQMGIPSEIFRRPKTAFVANFVGMKNIFKGEITGNKVTLESGAVFGVITTKRGAVTIAIRPEDIIVSRKPFVAGGLNKFHGRVISLQDKGALCKLTIDVGVLLTCLVLTSQVVEDAIKRGDTLPVAFKKSVVHVMR